MAFLSSRFVGFFFSPLSHLIDLCIDVYSYNFPKDKPVVKCLGEHLRLFNHCDGDKEL